MDCKCTCHLDESGERLPPSKDIQMDCCTELSFAAVEGESQRSIMRKAKAAVGMTRLRGRTYSFGNGYEFRPFGLCQVMFVNWS
jgi:hypothetical protein